MRRGLLSCLTVLLLMVLGPTQASEDDFRPRLLKDEQYTEGWDFYFLFEDGTWVTVQTIISNFGPGNHRGLVIGTVSMADGGSMVLKNGRPRDKWQFSPTGYDFKLARHRIQGGFPDYRIRLRNGRGELEIDLSATSPAWRPLASGSGSDRYYVSMFLTQLKASGRFRSLRERGPEQKWTALEGGRGYAVRYVNEKALSKVASGWLRLSPLHADGDEVPLMLFRTRPDGRQSNHLALLKEDVIAWQGHGFEVSYEQPVSMVRDGHPVPQTIALKLEQGGTSISGTIRVRQLFQRFDFVDELQKLERIFIRFINTPVHYRYLADYDLRVSDSEGTRRLTGTALTEFMTLKYQ